MEKFLRYNITSEVKEKDSQQADFVIAPLEKGFGTTIGNALRRTMLASIPGSAVFAIKIPGVTHEFQAIEGIKEDVTQIVLNLKNLVVRIADGVFSDEELSSLKIEQWPTLKLNFNGSGNISAKEIELPAGFEIVNTDLHIATATEKVKFTMEIYVTRGRGFKTFAQNRELINTLSIIATDSNFSPLVRVGYSVEEQKISKTQIGDVLTMSVATNGAISPSDAMSIASKILVEHLNPIVDINSAMNEMEVLQERNEVQHSNTMSIPIEDLNLSVRSYNCLKRRGIQTIQELTNMSKLEVEKIKNLGKKSLREIQKQLAEYGVAFKSE